MITGLTNDEAREAHEAISARLLTLLPNLAVCEHFGIEDGIAEVKPKIERLESILHKLNVEPEVAAGVVGERTQW